MKKRSDGKVALMRRFGRRPRVAKRACGWILAAAATIAPAFPQSEGNGIASIPKDSSRLRLDLKEAVSLALAPDGNTRIRLAQELVRHAEARSAQARSALLPNLDAAMSAQSQTRNLAAFGIRIKVPIPGVEIPEFVGPFTTTDMRAQVTQSIFDLSSIRRAQAARTGLAAARSDQTGTQQQVTGQVARAYALALRSDARVETARANLELAEALVELANSQKSAGTGTGIEVTRARVQLANERQRLLVAETEQRASRLTLLRLLGLELDGEIELTERFPEPVEAALSVEQALSLAHERRLDYLAQLDKEKAATLTYESVKWERLPSVVGFADYGAIGDGFDRALPTRTYGVSVRLPVFDGGRRDARQAEQSSLLRQEVIRTRDFRQQIDMEVRLALDALQSASAQLEVAKEGAALAEAELAQAQRRYRAGVAASLEVTDAQTRLARARDNRIAALFGCHIARIELAIATGTTERLLQ
jgi:outer membrane protein TolC